MQAERSAGAARFMASVNMLDRVDARSMCVVLERVCERSMDSGGERAPGPCPIVMHAVRGERHKMTKSRGTRCV